MALQILETAEGGATMQAVGTYWMLMPTSTGRLTMVASNPGGVKTKFYISAPELTGKAPAGLSDTNYRAPFWESKAPLNVAGVPYGVSSGMSAYLRVEITEAQDEAFFVLHDS